MVTISEKQIFQYIKCPILYDIQYNKSLDVSASLTIKNQLKSLIDYFLFQLYDGKIPSMNDLKKKWDILMKEIGSADPKKAIEGLGTLINIYNWAHKNKLTVVDINSKYTKRFGEYEVEGAIGPIISINNKLHYLVMDTTRKITNETLVDLNLKYTLDIYAFEHLYNKKIESIIVYNSKHNKEFVFFKNEEDFKRLETSITNVCKAIDTNIYYPNSTVLCESCIGNSLCRFWHS